MPGFVEKRRAVDVIPARDHPLLGEEVALGTLRKLAFVLAQVFSQSGVLSCAAAGWGIHGLRPLETAEVATWFCGLPFS